MGPSVEKFAWIARGGKKIRQFGLEKARWNPKAIPPASTHEHPRDKQHFEIECREHNGNIARVAV